MNKVVVIGIVILFLSTILLCVKCNKEMNKENYNEKEYKYLVDYQFGDWSWTPQDQAKRCKGGNYAV